MNSSLDDSLKNRRFATRAIHAGVVPEDNTGSVTTAIFASSTYRVSHPGDESGYVYSRSANPTRAALERALASLENGLRGFAFSSGSAAQSAVMHLLKPGAHVVAVSDLYGGTRRQFEQVMRDFGLEFTYVDGRDANEFEAAANPRTRLFWLETPTNPLLHLIDISKVSAIARKRDILTVVDNTFATPYLQQPLDLGVDIVLHSASKYLGGHCDVIAGALIVKDEKLVEAIGFRQNAMGAILGPFEAWLVLRGLKTLHLRMDRHSANAARIVQYLSTVDTVKRIYYPGHGGTPLLNNMRLSGGMVSFELKADFDAIKTFATAVRVFVLAESLGGTESLINHPASMTHASVPPEIRRKHGIGDNLIRLSVGIEDVDDLIDDLAQALAKIR